MLQFRNDTGLAGTAFAAPDPGGVDTIYAIVKGSFDVRTGRAADEQVPIVLKDEFHGDPSTSSIRVPSDVGLAKPGTDVLLLGNAYAPNGRPAYYVDVWIRLGPLTKMVRVFGDRSWSDTGVGASPSAPQPFQAIPLIWERAFGGSEETANGLTADARNPVGRGFRAEDSDRGPVGLPLPNLEDPAEPISSPGQKPAPACFAPVAAHWEPRRSFAGTYDERWLERRAPFLPDDFDPRFFQLAPDGLVTPGYLEGGESVDVRGATPDGVWQFQLPRIRVGVTFTVRGSVETRQAHLDTVLLEPDSDRVVLVWRAALPCDKKVLQVEEVLAESTVA